MINLIGSLTLAAIIVYVTEPQSFGQGQLQCIKTLNKPSKTITDFTLATHKISQKISPLQDVDPRNCDQNHQRLKESQLSKLMDWELSYQNHSKNSQEVLEVIRNTAVDVRLHSQDVISVCDKKGEVVSIAVIVQDPSTPDYLTLSDLIADPNKKGGGTAALNYLKDNLSPKYLGIRLNTLDSAKGFYLKSGFQDMGNDLMQWLRPKSKTTRTLSKGH